jgi:hypothetical protein
MLVEAIHLRLNLLLQATLKRYWQQTVRPYTTLLQIPAI